MKTQTSDSQQTTDTSTPSLGELSFADYERVRMGGEMPKAEAKSAPTAAGKTGAQKEHKESPESDTEETEAKLSDTEADSEHNEGEEETKEIDQDKPKKKGGFQRRIDKLNQRYSAAQQEAEYWKQQALKNAGADKTKESEKADTPKKQAASQDGRPDPDTFATHAEYVEAVADWKAEQKLKARDEAAEKAKLQAEIEQTQKAHIQRVKSFAEKVEDFSDVLAEVDDIILSPTLESELLTSENGPELMYELAKDRKELERINALHPLKIARELGKVEARIAARASEAATKKTETKKLTQAPKPIDPVGGTKGSVAKSITDPDISFAEYERLRREQEKRRGA